MSKEIRIGYWGWKPDDEYPMPVAGTALPDQTEVITKLRALMRGGRMMAYRGWSTCRLCSKPNGSKELEIIQGDTKWRIPEGYIHYLEDHHVGYDPRVLEIVPATKRDEL